MVLVANLSLSLLPVSRVRARFVRTGDEVAVVGSGRFTVTGVDRIVVGGVDSRILFGTNYAGQGVSPIVACDAWVTLAG